MRAVGGLADTVFDRDYSERPYEQRNGYVFDHADYPPSSPRCAEPSGCGTTIRRSFAA